MEKWERRIAIVILNYNSSALTIECAEKYRELSNDFSLVIVDNGSTDNSLEEMKKFFADDKNTVVIGNSENIGYACGNNVGIRYVEKHLKNVDAVCISNPDIVVNSLEVMRKLYEGLFSDDRLAVITAMTIYNGEVRTPNECAWKHHTRKSMMFGSTLIGRIFPANIRYSEFNANEKGVAYVDFTQGCFFMAKMSHFKKVGYFDEGTFLYEEEAILGRKITRAGLKEGVLVSDYICHNHREKEKNLVKKQNKIFDMKCFYNSKKYYNRKFSDRSRIFSFLCNSYLNLDYCLKRFLLLFR